MFHSSTASDFSSFHCSKIGDLRIGETWLLQDVQFVLLLQRLSGVRIVRLAGIIAQNEDRFRLLPNVFGLLGDCRTDVGLEESAPLRPVKVALVVAPLPHFAATDDAQYIYRCPLRPVLERAWFRKLQPFRR